MSGSVTQPPRKLGTLVTEIPNKEDPHKPAIIEHPDTNLYTTEKQEIQGLGDLGPDSKREVDAPSAPDRKDTDVPSAALLG